MTVEDHLVVAHVDGAGIPTVHGVELDEVGCGSRVGVRIVHVDEFEVVAEFAAVSEPTGDQPADPSEPVDTDSNGHDRER